MAGQFYLSSQDKLLNLKRARQGDILQIFANNWRISTGPLLKQMAGAMMVDGSVGLVGW